MNPILLMIVLGGLAWALSRQQQAAPSPSVANGSTNGLAFPDRDCVELGSHVITADDGTAVSWQFVWCDSVLWGKYDQDWEALIAPIDEQTARAQVEALAS